MSNNTPNTSYIKAKKRANGSLIEDYGDNHPKNAYVVLGHGNEGWKLKTPIKPDDSKEEQERKKMDIEPDLIKVPKGSIVVIKSHSGDVTSDKDTMIHYANVIAKENEKYVLDPIKYIDDITRIFGSVSIFREGDMCPNLLHVFISDFKNEGMPIALEPSCIVQIPLKEPMNFEEAKLYMTSKIYIPLDMTVKEYKEQRDKGGFSIEEQLKLHSSPTGVNLLVNTVIKNLENKDNQEQKMNEFYNDTFNRFALDQNNFFKNRPNSITYAFNCRYINNHPTYVPEHVRLGLKSEGNMYGIPGLVSSHVTKYNAKRLNEEHRIQGQYKNQVKHHLNTNGKSGKSYNEIRNPKDMPNNALNLAKTRKRVKNMAPEIKQQISESVLQRKLGAVASSKQNRNTNKMNGILKEYLKNISKNDKNAINTLEKMYPGIKKRYYNSIINNDNSHSNINRYHRLTEIEPRYANRKNNITRKIKNITNRKINTNINSLSKYQWKNYEKILENISKANNTRKNTVSKKLSELHNHMVNDILNSEITDYVPDEVNNYTTLNKIGDKTDPKVKERINKLLDVIYDYYKKFIGREPTTEHIIELLDLNNSDDNSELIAYLKKRVAEEPQIIGNNSDDNSELIAYLQ